MGSSKKHKEKRDKKKHKRERSRSRSRDRDGYRRSRKSRKEVRKERYPCDDEARGGYGKKVYDDKTESPEDHDLLGEGTRNEKYDVSTTGTAISSRDSDEDIDIDMLLDSKLEREIPDKKASRKLSVAEKLRGVELLTKRRPHSEHSDGAGTSSYGNDQLEVPRRSSLEEDSWLKKPQVKEELLEERADSSSKQADAGDAVLEEGKVHLSLSVNETNKLRAKLGLKPLEMSEEIPGLGGGSDEKTAETTNNEVFVKTINIAEVKHTEKLKEKLQVMKEKRKITEKLSNVKPLGESDSEDESPSAWVEKSRKLQLEKEQAEKRAKLLEEMDAEFGVAALVEENFDAKKTYTSKDLRGMKVVHDSSVLEEGQQMVLTLKDKGVLDEEEDVLQNVNLVDEERYAKNVENRKRKKDYQPYEEEYDEFGILKKKTVLSKYDEEIHGVEKKTFTLGSSAQVDKEKEIEMIRMKLKQQQGVTLDMPNLKLANEYYTPADMVQFKRPKKKKRQKRSGMLKADDLLPISEQSESENLESRNDAETVNNGNGFRSWEPAYQTRDDSVMRDPDEDDVVMNEDLSKVIIDEDQAEKELHSALHRVRKQKQRSMLHAPEKVVAEAVMKSENEDEPEQSSKAGSIVLNSTAEFCRTLGDIPTYGMSGNRDEEADELLDFERELLEERQRQELEAQNRGAWNEVHIDETPGEITMRENEPILEEEPDISMGVAGALKLAQKKGYLDKEMKKQLTGPRASQLQAKSYTIEEKFYEDDKFGKRDRCTGPIQDFREKNNYKPDVKLEYIDDSGRLLNAKEAFRYLSHKFHGKGPGKNKVDKRMKKLDQDTKLKQMSSTDTPLNTVKLLQAKQKETQSPYIVLSGGSKALTQTMISKPKQP